MSAPLDVGVIDAAVDVLVTGGWVQGTLETGEGAHCAHGAVLATVSTPDGARHYAMLTGPWASVIGPAHPDDTPGVSDG